MKVAAVNWKLRRCASPRDFFDHVESVLDLCGEVDLAVLPELCSLELLSAVPHLAQAEIAAYLADLMQAELESLGRISRERGLWLCAGSHFVRTPNGIANAAVVAAPDGRVVAANAKNVLTQFEANDWGIVPGAGLTYVPEARFGVTVCYDCEFPDSSRALAEAGALVQCVPAFTETARGFHRVRWCCQARAVENQIFVVHASLVGDLGREPVPSTYGTSAVLCPVLDLFPESGVLAETALGKEAAAVAEVDFNELTEARQTGDVRNWNDRNKGVWAVSEPLSAE